MFKKLVAIENTLLHEDALKKLSDYAACVELHDERAADEDELIRRIGDADAVLVSFKTTISKTVLDACPNIRYIGMCCTLYEQACNVDLTKARKLGITVTGVRDYGDEGVVEYAISELVRFLHGFGECQWKPVRQELTRQKVGVIGLGRNYFNEGMLAFHGDVNLMKGAIMASTYVTTVSPTYAQELRMPFYAHGMDAVINQQSGKLQGILNGIDMALYDPAKKPGLAANFTAKNPAKGKTACKLALQKAVGLREDESAPIIACVSRLVGHKGFSLVTDVLHQIMEMNVQMVVLGTGDWQYEEAFRNAQRQYPGRFSAQITYSAPLSDMIYAGADIFLMPSISEPCGLSQMIAMRFGTVPVVRETGGLKDTVLPYNKFEGTGRGFTFSDINAGDMLWVIREAVDLYHNNKEAWRGLQKEGMTADFSWDHSAQEYIDIYQRISG